VNDETERIWKTTVLYMSISRYCVIASKGTDENHVKSQTGLSVSGQQKVFRILESLKSATEFLSVYCENPSLLPQTFLISCDSFEAKRIKGNKT